MQDTQNLNPSIFNPSCWPHWTFWHKHSDSRNPDSTIRWCIAKKVLVSKLLQPSLQGYLIKNTNSISWLKIAAYSQICLFQTTAKCVDISLVNTIRYKRQKITLMHIWRLFPIVPTSVPVAHAKIFCVGLYIDAQIFTLTKLTNND